jgi:hypothetical protein
MLLAILAGSGVAHGQGLFVEDKKEEINERAEKKAEEDPNAWKKLPLILPGKHTRKQRVPWQVMDGGNNHWNIYRNGYIQYGGHYIYSGGMKLELWNSSLNQNHYEAQINKHAQEAQFGPWKRNNCVVYRRVRVYREIGLARWLEIVRNPTDKDIDVRLEIKTSLYGSMREKKWSNGSENFRKDDWWVATRTHNYRNNDKIWSLHIFRDPSSKLCPSISVSGDDINYTYTKVTVPAGQTIVFCHFEAQGERKDIKKMLATDFRPYKLLQDLPASARGRIVNFPPTFSFAGITVRRRQDVDTIELADGKNTIRHGTLRSAAMTMETSLGSFTVPGEQIVCGEVSDSNDVPDTLILGDGQVLTGRLADDALLFEPIDSNDPSPVALREMRAFSFAASEKRPMEIGFDGPYLVVEGGSRLAFDNERFRLQFLSRFGSHSLKPADIARVRFTGHGAICHRVQLINGSLLAGIIRDPAIRVDLRLGRTASIPRHQLTDLSFAEHLDPNPFLTRVELTNDDVLHGQLIDKSYGLRSAFGKLHLTPGTVKEMTFASKHLGAANITTWEGTQLRGVLTRQTIRLKLTENISVDLAPSQCRSITRAQPLPPDEVLASVNATLGRIRSTEDFDARVGELRKIGAGIVPLIRRKLRKRMHPSLRERYRELVSEFTDDGSADTAGPEMLLWGGGFRGVQFAVPQQR